MSQVTITINSREYAVACEDGQEVSIIKLSRLLDEKAKLLTQGGSQQVNENMLLAMVGLLLADELCELKKNTSTNSPVTGQTETPIMNGFNDADISTLDNTLSEKIQALTGQIKSIANQIKML